MKVIFLISIGFIVLANTVLCQCPKNGLKVQSANCEDPKNLSVDTVGCSLLEVKWRGNKAQTYLVKASYADPLKNETVETEGTAVTCDNNGNCRATINVKEGTTVSWSIEAICSIAGATLYSTTVRGPEVNIPKCESRRANIRKSEVSVYPNPANSYIIVNYSGKVTGTVQFRIFDITGKKVYDRTANNVIKTNNQYKLDIHNLLPGSYLLEAYDGTIINQSKFVIMRT